jgi:hypothetical protein
MAEIADVGDGVQDLSIDAEANPRSGIRIFAIVYGHVD